MIGMNRAEARSLAGEWRLVDIVTLAVIAVVFGGVFELWNALWATLQPAFVGFPPIEGVIYGIWLVPAVLGALIVQRPGAALFTELVAAIVSVFFGAQWGLLLVVYGLMQGAAAELVFAFALYRAWGPVVATVAGAAAGAAAVLLDLVNYYPGWTLGWQVVYAVIVIVSAALIAGVGGWLLVRALAQTGVLAPFPAGRSQSRV